MNSKKTPEQLHRERTLRDIIYRLFKISVRLENLQCNPTNFLKSFAQCWEQGPNMEAVTDYEKSLKQLIINDIKTRPARRENDTQSQRD